MSEFAIPPLESMGLSSIIDLMLALADELVRRDQDEPLHLYSVKGSYGSDSLEVTEDFALEPDEDAARNSVSRVRSVTSDRRIHSLTSLHLDNVRRSISVLSIPPELHAARLERTLADLFGARCTNCRKPWNADNLAASGRCSVCEQIAA